MIDVIWPMSDKASKVVKNYGCKLVDRWGIDAEGFMIGGMAPTSWFNALVIEGWALISDEEDFSGRSPIPMLGPDGGVEVTLLNGISQLGIKNSTGHAGDWVVKYAPDDIRIFNERSFNYQFVIVDRGLT